MNAEIRSNGNWIRVWDPLVRIGHWTLVAAFFTSWLSGDEWQNLHVWSGYLLGSVLIVRIVWGFVGTRYARFSDFVRSPAVVKQYLKELLGGRPTHYVGHNPAGGLMIIVLMLSLGMTLFSGLELYAVEENKGPLAAIELPGGSAMSSIELLPRALADDDDDEHEPREHRGRKHHEEEGEEFWEELHEFFANFTLMLVLVHIAGVVVSSVLHRENLVRAMISGLKPQQ